MRFSTTSLFAIACIAPTALAEIVMTLPIASTTCTGGQNCTVSWSAGINPPTLQECGSCDFAVYVGSAQQQTSLQVIKTAVPVATTGGIVFTVDPTIGPNFSGYFIRVQCPIADPTNPLLPELAFSHMFTLAGMSGTFSAAVQAQISGSAAPAGTPTSTSTSSSSTATGGTTTSKSTSTTAKPTSTSTTSGAITNSVRRSLLLVVVASVSVLF